jgi:sirohydrochlorin ferrochelatase
VTGVRPPLLLVSHGTRQPAGAAVAAELAERVGDALPGVRVAHAFADVRGPAPADVLPGLLAGATGGSVVVLPVFLSSGYHVRTDLPAQLAAIGVRPESVLAPALGPALPLVRACAERLRAAGTRPGDAVVLGAAGSSRPDARAEVHVAAQALGRVLGRRVRVGFLAGPGPRLDEVVVSLRERGRRVAVASWLLAPGFFQDRLRGCGAEVCAEPLAGHPGVVEAVLAGYGAFRGAHAPAA